LYKLNFRINVHYFQSKKIEKGVAGDFSVQVLQALSCLQTQNLNKSVCLLYYLTDEFYLVAVKEEFRGGAKAANHFPHIPRSNSLFEHTVTQLFQFRHHDAPMFAFLTNAMQSSTPINSRKLRDPVCVNLGKNLF